MKTINSPYLKENKTKYVEIKKKRQYLTKKT